MLQNKYYFDPLADNAARAVVLICVLNLNGVIYMALNIPQIGTLVIFVSCLVLIFKMGKLAWTIPFALIFTTIIAYLFFGSLFYDPLASADPQMKFVRSYLSSILIIWAISAYTCWLGERKELFLFLRFIRNGLMVSVISIYLSPVIYALYITPPPAGPNRFAGFFYNPNEAGMVACLAQVFVIAFPFEKKVVQLVALTLAFAAVFLTFSKTAISLAILIFVLAAIRTLGKRFFIALPILIVPTIFITQNLISIFDALANQTYFDLSSDQRTRLHAIGRILSGTINADTSTNRTEMWNLGYQRAMENWPWGDGLGSYHSFHGGLVNTFGTDWLGIHNTYLMIWGEAGIYVLLLLLAAILSLLVSTLRLKPTYFQISIILILLVDMTASHNALMLRYHNLALAVVLGMLAFASRQKGRKKYPQQLYMRRSPMHFATF